DIPLLRGLSVRVQMVTLAAAFLVAMSTFVCVFFPARIQQPTEAALQASASALAEQLAAEVGPQLAFGNEAAVREQLQKKLGRRGLTYVQVFDERGSLVVSAGRATDAVPPAQALARQPVVDESGDAELRIAQPLLAHDRPSGALVLGVSREDTQRQIRSYRQVTLVASLALLLLGILGALATSTLIARPLQDVAARLGAMARGDFTGRSHVATSRDTLMLSAALNKMADHVAAALREVGQASTEVVRAAQDFATSFREMRERAAGESEASESVAASVNEMARSVQETSRRVQEALAMASESKLAAQRGVEVIHRATGIMQQTAGAVETMAGTLNGLSAHSDRIGEVVDVIEEIAEQTNLLALNAAIEAARAGDQGRGFAVVADEVRKLAERTQQATKEIAGRVRAVQTGTQEVIQAMQAGRSATETGRQALASEAGDSLHEILRLSGGVEVEVENIAVATRQQALVSEEIAGKVENIAAVARATAESAGHSAEASRTLGTRIESLIAKLGRFRLSGTARIREEPEDGRRAA
ncbi:MAG TPA: methyl-accepting chemotaxis protein, partial [Candidatus Saccharimonadales bacterium]|nr:methyl-accepting chemotaxis protein [Candidatus Saccharimonadales bacterium]